MNRRSFIGSIAAFAAQCTLDPELALWRPGAKLISIPKPTSTLSIEEFQTRYILPAIQRLFDDANDFDRRMMEFSIAAFPKMASSKIGSTIYVKRPDRYRAAGQFLDSLHNPSERQ